MKPRSQHRRTLVNPDADEKQPRPLILALMLTGILALEAYPTFVKNAMIQTQAFLTTPSSTPRPVEMAQESLKKLFVEPDPDPRVAASVSSLCRDPHFCDSAAITPTYQVLPNPLFAMKGRLPKITPVSFDPASLTSKLSQMQPSNSTNPLPAEVASAVRQALIEQNGINPEQIKIVEAIATTWSDTCLGLGQAHESCGQMLVEGWRVVVSDSRQTWVYRTDAQGEQLRLESQSQVRNLPLSVATAVLQDAIARIRLSNKPLKIIAVVPQIWPDGCLGLAEPGTFCTQGMVSGWQVFVASGSDQWVYRTNQTGSRVKLDQAPNSTQTIAYLSFLKIPGGELFSSWRQPGIWSNINPCRISEPLNPQPVHQNATCNNNPFVNWVNPPSSLRYRKKKELEARD